MERTIMRFLSLITLFISLTSLWGGVPIDPTNRIDWVIGNNVGVQSSMNRTRTHLIDVTQAPYNADNTGTLDASIAINSAITAAASNDVVYLPDGRYIFSNGLNITKSYITIRGQSTNTSVIGNVTGSPLYCIKLGPDRQTGTTTTIISGSTKGSSQIVLGSPPTSFMQAGDQITVTESVFGMVPTSENNPQFPVIGSRQAENLIQQQCLVASVSGNTVNLTAPLAWNFTNSPVVVDCGIHSVIGTGLENITIMPTNTVNHATAVFSFTLYLSMCQNCWMTNVAVEYPANYGIYITSGCHISMQHGSIRHATSTGSNHSGLLIDSTGESLIEDSIFADNLQPGIEFNGGVVGDAFFGDFFTNNASTWDVDAHNAHPMMNLFEACVMAGRFEMDGYFGSASHQTLFRNTIRDSSNPVKLCRWITYMQIVGNVLGRPGGVYSALVSESQGGPNAIILAGYPNIGNGSYTYTSPPVAWNWPGNQYTGVDGLVHTNGSIKQIGTVVNTNTIWGGDFTWVPQHVPGVDTIIFQDGGITNLYWPHDGTAYNSPLGGTSSNVVLNTTVTVSNGWTLYMAFQNTYQQSQQTNIFTDNIQGNYDYFNNSLIDGTNTLPVSLLYTNGAPNYWGANRWPAIDPSAFIPVTTIPAQLRYAGIATQPSIARVTNFRVNNAYKP